MSMLPKPFVRNVTITLVAAAILLLGLPRNVSAQQTVPPPRFVGPIRSTTNSYAFLSANRVQAVVDLQKAGYVEEEYIVSGTANVYEWARDGSVEVKTSNAPYTARILVRRPPSATRFSGNVILEPLQNNRSWDWAFMWGKTTRSQPRFRERTRVLLLNPITSAKPTTGPSELRGWRVLLALCHEAISDPGYLEGWFRELIARDPAP
jgi:hypothetical protein